jgi:GNAT superfamily N-acetyltransferase
MREEWEEVALDKDQIPLSINYDQYRTMESKGILYILSARHEGRLVGYYIAFVYPHFHYAEAGLMAFCDVYYMQPRFRRGGFGVQLLAEAERVFRERGVVKSYMSCKVHQDHTDLFEKLGWRKSDFCFIKMLN